MLIPNKFSGYRRDGARVYPKKGSAPAPDPRMAEAANRQIDLAEAQWADYQANERPWIQNMANEALGISRSQANRANALSDYQLENMKFNDARYRDVAIPFEDQLLADVNRFDSAGYKAQQVSSAMGDVQQSFSNAADQQRRGLARMGVNPNSGKSLAASAGMGFEQAKAMANAANKTRMAADQIGLSSKMSMYGGMKGLAGLGNANAALATGAMGTGLNAASSISAGGNNMVSANNSTFNSAMGGMSAGVSGLGNYAQLGQSATKINNDADPFASILGAGAQLGAAYLGRK